MKKNNKKFLALVCALTVAFTSISAPFGNKAEAASKTTFASSKYADWERVTFSELGFADGTYTNLKDGKKGGMKDFTLDGKVISGNIRFEGAGTIAVFGGDGSDWERGLKMIAQENGDLLLSSHVNNSRTTIKQDVVGTGATLVGGTFNLKLSYELVNGTYDADAETKDTLVLGLWINNTLYNNQYFNFDAINPLGGGADRGARYTNGIMSILVPTSTDDNKFSITLSTSFEDSAYVDWDQVSFEDYGKEDGYHGPNTGNNYGESSIPLNDKVFHGNIQFPTDSYSYMGLGDIWGEKDLIYITSDSEQVTVTGITKALDGNIAGRNLIGTELNLKLTYDVYDSDGDEVDDVLKLGVWINNILYNTQYIEIANYTNFIKKGMYLHNITISTPKPEVPPAIEFQDSEYAYWEQVTFSNYGVEDNTAYSGHKDFWCNTGRANKVFNGNVQLSSFYYSHINMGNANAEVGFIVTSDKGKVNFAIMAGEAHPIDSEIGTAFNLKLSYHVLDDNGDGEGDKLKLGVWINNKLYNNQYFEVEDYSKILDPWMGIYASAADPVTVSSAKDEVYFQDSEYQYWDQFTFSDFGVTDQTFNAEKHIYKPRPTLLGTVFNGNIFISEDSASAMYLAGAGDFHAGVKIASDGQGGLRILDEAIPTTVVSAGTKFNLKLSYDLVTNEDETTYLKLGVWFNDVLYKYFEITSYGGMLGHYMCIASGGENAVSIESVIPTTYQMADIAVPETGIVNPPVVVQKVTNADKYQALADNGAAIAIIDVDASLNLLDASGNIMKDASNETITANTFLEDYWETVIPAFRIDSEEEADALLVFLKRYNPYDSYVVADSENVAYLNKVRTAYTKIGGILEYNESLDKAGREASRRLANNNMVSTILLPEGSVTVDIVNEYNIRMFNVWSYASDKAGVYEGIANGYNGMVSTDAATITAVYESITVPTISGKPQAVGHAGYNQKVYPANTITAFEAAKKYGASGIEIDPQTTADGYIVLSHDNGITDINGTPYTISQMSLADLKNITLVSGDGKETGKICTLDEAIAWAKENGMVVYLHMVYSQNLFTAFETAVETLGMEDNVVAFARADLVNAGLGNYMSWYNNSDISTIGGGRYVNDLSTNTSAMDSVDHALYSLIEICRVVNDQNMPLNAYETMADFAKGDTFYYQMAARGFLGMHSQVFDQAVVDDWMITGAGLTTALFDYPSMINDYLVDIDAEDAIYEIGKNIKLEQNVKRIKGDNAVIECGIEQVAGTALTKSGKNYTMNTAGTATVVYYADVTLERGDKDLTYRLYSEPVDITFAEDTDIHFANTKYAEWDRVTFKDYNLDRVPNSASTIHTSIHAWQATETRHFRGACAASTVLNALEGKVLSGKVAFSDDISRIYIGGITDQDGAQSGMVLERNKTKYAKGISLYAQGRQYDFDPDIAGVDLVENEFDLKLSYEVVTAQDGTKSLKLGVFFNGKLYNNEYIEISTWQVSGTTHTYEEYLGRWLVVQVQDTAAKGSWVSVVSEGSELMNMSVEITDSIAMNYVVKTTCTEVPTMTFTLEGSNTSITVEGELLRTLRYTGEYKFTFPDIKPQDMAKKITATLQVGSAYTRTWEYSVMDYCEQLLKVQEASSLTTASGAAYTDAQLTALKELVVDLIEYATQVQKYGANSGQLGAVNEADLMTTILGNAVPGYAGYDKVSDTELGELSGVVAAKLSGNVSEETALYKWTGATLVFKDTIQIRGRFKLLNGATVENLKMMVSIDGAAATEYDFAVTPYGSQGEYYVDFSGIYATEFSKTISITFYCDDVAVGNTLNYSVNTYLQAKSNTTDSYLKQLLLAINGYGNAASVFKSLM